MTNYNHSHTITQEETDVNESNKQSMYMALENIFFSISILYSSLKLSYLYISCLLQMLFGLGMQH